MPQKLPPVVAHLRPTNPSADTPLAPPKESPAASPPIGRYADRIRRALSLIDEGTTTPSQYRAVLGGYYRSIGSGRVEYPRTLRRHPANPEHGTECGPWLTFYFHLGNAITAYHAVIAPTDNVAAAKAILDSRIALLEQLAAVGPSRWNVCGDEAQGFWLEAR